MARPAAGRSQLQVVRVYLVGGAFVCGTSDDGFYGARKEIKHDTHHDDRGAGGNVEQIGQKQPAEAVDKTDNHGDEHHVPETADEKSGGELGNGEERNDQDDTDHAETTHDGQGHDEGEGGFKCAHGQALCAGEIGIVGDSDDDALEGEEEEEREGGEQAH